MVFNIELVERLKKELNVTKDLDLAKFFDVTPFIFSSWKRSKARLIEEVVKYGVENKLDFNKIFYDEEVGSKKECVIPIFMANDLFEYCFNPAKEASDLPWYSLLDSIKEDVGFQSISQNMEPTIRVSSIVFGKKTLLENLNPNEICILHTKTKGIYISRFLSKKASDYIFVNDNVLFEDFEFSEEEIVNVFKVSGVFNSLKF